MNKNYCNIWWQLYDIQWQTLEADFHIYRKMSSWAASTRMQWQNHTTQLYFSHLPPSECYCCRNPGLNMSCSGFLQKLSMCLLSQPDLTLGACQHGTQSSLACCLAQFDFHAALLWNTVWVFGGGWRNSSTVVSCKRARSGETVLDILTHWFRRPFIMSADTPSKKKKRYLGLEWHFKLHCFLQLDMMSRKLLNHI